MVMPATKWWLCLGGKWYDWGKVIFMTLGKWYLLLGESDSYPWGIRHLCTTVGGEVIFNKSRCIHVMCMHTCMYVHAGIPARQSRRISCRISGATQNTSSDYSDSQKNSWLRNGLRRLSVVPACIRRENSSNSWKRPSVIMQIGLFCVNMWMAIRKRQFFKRVEGVSLPEHFLRRSRVCMRVCACV